jgi:hypothetical protein
MQLEKEAYVHPYSMLRDWLCKPSLRLVGKEKIRMQENSNTKVFSPGKS